jgi:hypothetical protein
MRSLIPKSRGAATLSIALVLSLACGLPSACSPDGGSGTTGRRVKLGVTIAGSQASRTSFTNAEGWSITMSKVLVSTGPLYYYDGATIFSRLWQLVGERTAYAHPGHYVPGTARGELLTGSSVDLRSESSLGVGDGVSGTVRSATFSFQSPAVGPHAAELGSHVAVLEGTGTKGGETRIFHVDIDPADVDSGNRTNTIEGCPFAETDMNADGTVTITVAVEEWFDQVELDALPASTDGRPVTFPADFLGRAELVRGMKEALGYRFAYRAAP